MKRRIRNDIILIIIMASTIIGLFLWWGISKISYEPLYVNIYHDEELLYSIPLDENKEIVVKGEISDVKIIIKNSYVWVSESDCYNHTCIKQGKKNKRNETITCLPNLVYVKVGYRIVGESNE